MNQGVEILLARMDSNPEEFAGEFYEAGVYQRKLGKWEWLIDALKCNRMEDRKAALPYLTNQEIEALYSKYQELLRDNFTCRVMSVLLEEKELSFSSPVNREQLLTEMLPDIEKLFGAEYTPRNIKGTK